MTTYTIELLAKAKKTGEQKPYVGLLKFNIERFHGFGEVSQHPTTKATIITCERDRLIDVITLINNMLAGDICESYTLEVTPAKPDPIKIATWGDLAEYIEASGLTGSAEYFTQFQYSKDTPLYWDQKTHWTHANYAYMQPGSNEGYLVRVMSNSSTRQGTYMQEHTELAMSGKFGDWKEAEKLTHFINRTLLDIVEPWKAHTEEG